MKKLSLYKIILIFAIAVSIVNIALGIVVATKLTIFAHVAVQSLLVYRILLATSILNGILILTIISYLIFRKD